MGRKKKSTPSLPAMEPQKYSFDPETIIYLSAMDHTLMDAIKTRMVEVSSDPKCIPVSVARKVVKEFGLSKYEHEDYK